MNRIVSLAAAGATTLAALVAAAPVASAATLSEDGGGAQGASHAVFALTNNPSGNQVAAYHRAGDGTLSPAGTYATGGLGGVLGGAVVDKLASQGALTYDRQARLLFAVNAGSDSVSVFSVVGDRLTLRQVVGSGGSFPVSVAVHGRLAAVLDGGGSGAVQLYRVEDRRLRPVASESLGLNPVSGPTQFLNTPGQVGFTPSGRQLVVTTKLNGNNIDVIGLREDGRLAPLVANPAANPVPFGFVFDRAGRLVDGEAGTSAVTTYRIAADSRITPISSATDNQKALCWITNAGRYQFVANAASNSVSGYSISPTGTPRVVSQTPTEAGPIDLAASKDGSYLYVEAGGTGTIDAYAVARDGSLSPVQSGVAVGLGLEGIVAA